MNPPCPMCKDGLRYVEGEVGIGGNQLIFWVCDCGFRDPVRCPHCRNIITTYLRNGLPDVPSPGFYCGCGFFSVPEVAS